MATGAIRGLGNIRRGQMRPARIVALSAAHRRPAHAGAAGANLGVSRVLEERAARADDVGRDGTADLIAASAQLLALDEGEQRGALGQSIADRLQKRERLGRTGMTANPRRREETRWLEELTIGDINRIIAERKAHVIEHHIAAGTQKNRITAMCQWVEFCEIQETSPLRDLGLHRQLTRLEVAANEDLLIDFAIYESWRIAPPSVGQYVSHVVNWHIMELGVDLKEGTPFLRLARVLKGLKKLYPCAKRVRLGLKPSTVRSIVALLKGQLRRGGHTPQSRRAFRFILFVTWCYQGLYRGGEGASGNAFDPAKHLCCSDPRIADGGRVLVVRNPELKVRSLEASRTPFPFPIDAGDDLCFGWWYTQRDAFDPLDDGEVASITPLFRDPTRCDPRTGRPACLSYDDALRTLRDCIAALLPGADPSLYGLHSLRIGAASALFALNCPPLVLQSLGRWQSDIYELYCRANRAQLVQWTSRIGTAQYTTLEEMA